MCFVSADELLCKSDLKKVCICQHFSFICSDPRNFYSCTFQWLLIQKIVTRYTVIKQRTQRYLHKIHWKQNLQMPFIICQQWSTLVLYCKANLYVYNSIQKSIKILEYFFEGCWCFMSPASIVAIFSHVLASTFFKTSKGLKIMAGV